MNVVEILIEKINELAREAEINFVQCQKVCDELNSPKLEEFLLDINNLIYKTSRFLEIKDHISEEELNSEETLNMALETLIYATRLHNTSQTWIELIINRKTL